DHLGKEATEAAAWPSFPLGTTLRNPFNRQFWAGLFSPAPRICGARSGVRSLAFAAAESFLFGLGAGAGAGGSAAFLEAAPLFRCASAIAFRPAALIFPAFALAGGHLGRGGGLRG